MIQQICRKILLDWWGWQDNVTIDMPDKYILCVAPHTSNWDFIIGSLYCRAKGFQCNFMMKKEWFFWPMGILMRRLGGIPVYRNKKMHTTEIIAQQARQMKEFHLCITPEGTRKANAEWKKGFYYIALNAGIPILLYAIDFPNKRIECTESFLPTGNIEEDMPKIKAYYSKFKGKHPEKFAY